jgi:beta-N-acetylhexosaminidase
MRITTMNAVELIGQNLMFRFDGTEFSPDAREAFREIRPGGILFFSQNITSREQVHALTTELQAEARRLGMPPLLIAADQEGGIVSRFSSDFVTPPSPMALGAAGNPGDTLIAATITAMQMREVGINVNFAPSVDVNNNPANPVIRTRSFGDSPTLVAEQLEWMYRGHEAARVATTVKHFPGHGDTGVDSHFGLPTIPGDRERFEAIELSPFRAAVRMGVPAVMSAHILFPTLDPDLPATLSPAILTGLLRRDMGFGGVIFTDAMDMRAVSERFGLVESTILAKLAGVDMLEANEPIADQMVRFEALRDAVESGRIPLEAVRASSDRIDALRQRYAITGEPTSLPERDNNRSMIAFNVARRTIAHVGPKPFRTVSDEPGVVFVDFQRYRTNEAADPVNRTGVLRAAAAMNLPNATIATLGDEPAESEIADAAASARNATTLIVMTRDASDNPQQIEIANRVIAAAPADARIMHCCMRGPYDATLLSRADDHVFTFGDPKVSIDAMVAFLIGLPQEPARMPVEVPGLRRWEHMALQRAARARKSAPSR